MSDGCQNYDPGQRPFKPRAKTQPKPTPKPSPPSRHRCPSCHKDYADALETALNTLRQIAETPHNKGARLTARATLAFLETQLSPARRQ